MPFSVTLIVGICLEGGLGVVAAVIAYFLRISPWGGLHWNVGHLAIGIGAALPMLVMFEYVVSDDWPPFQKIRWRLDSSLRPLLRDTKWPGLFSLSFAAGIGEEMLFRAVAQGWLARHMGAGWALVVASLLFGVAHPITRAYAVVVTGIGLYLGGLWMLTGNLLVPIVAHGLYDFVALMIYLRPSESKSRQP